MASVSIWAGLVTRTWRVGGAKSVVQLHHNTITGDLQLSVDSAAVPGSRSNFTYFSNAKTVAFEAAGRAGTVTLEVRGQRVFYTCVHDGAPQPEDNAVAASALSADLGKLKIGIAGTDKGVDEHGKAVTWYRVHTSRDADGRETMVHRRFRDFYALNEAVRSAYKGSHLLSSFPVMPPRFLAFLQDHFSSDFVEKRRAQLGDFLAKLEGVPRMRSNPDFLAFIGLIDRVRESSVLFPGDGAALGIKLREAKGFTEVAEVTGGPAAALAGGPGELQVGAKVSKLNGEDVLGLAYEVLVARLKAAPRPLVIHFLGWFADKHQTVEQAAAEAVAPLPELEPEPEPEPAPAPAPPPPPSEAAPAIEGLIGGGISYAGTGATPKPAAMRARKGPSQTTGQNAFAPKGVVDDMM